MYIKTLTDVTYRVQQSPQHFIATCITRLVAATCCSDSVFSRAISTVMATVSGYENTAVGYTRYDTTTLLVSLLLSAAIRTIPNVCAHARVCGQSAETENQLKSY